MQLRFRLQIHVDLNLLPRLEKQRVKTFIVTKCVILFPGSEAARYMLRQMQKSPEGNEILKLRPRINSKTVDLEKLKGYPEGTIGKTYSNFLVKNVCGLVLLCSCGDCVFL